MKDNKGFVELEGRLTSLGKKRVLENNFDITKFAVSDDGVNYGLINENLLDPYLAIERAVLFNKHNDSNQHLRNRITIDKPTTTGDSIHDFNLKNDTNVRINPIDSFFKANFPQFEGGSVNRFEYYITDADLANKRHETEMTIENENIPLFNQVILSPISITLHNSKYFDIRLKEEERIAPSSLWNAEDYNWESAFEDSVDDQYSKPSQYPKTITMLNMADRPNKFNLVYRGNFKYEGKSRSDFNSYNEFEDNRKMHRTALTIRCEKTGKYQEIMLEIYKTEPKSES